ncbi:hypothetical protein K435DRAFT_874635 [Dendrothele bispora CBS 962.96]|uniref:Uncharacterized protein n=1 Tax=Dendrothele bispora (strain CBS 962.96) TaxID=1314807 RepID=A0A4V4HBP1_DENBC|nr:hypothetical protein K435DRAFT_874635 [Dendrothele bispora CBS 962.96]
MSLPPSFTSQPLCCNNGQRQITPSPAQSTPSSDTHLSGLQPDTRLSAPPPNSTSSTRPSSDQEDTPVGSKCAHVGSNDQRKRPHTCIR